jgi:SpoVK/Ycf46/Vps4 family AAA+-type ATPase
VHANARDLAALAQGDKRNGATAVSFADVVAAARARSDQRLGALAVKVEEERSWDRLVLPPATLARVREFAAAVRQRHVVFAEWGFSPRRDGVAGLVALFAGASGTGKTMTAGVIAHDLGVDLYRVDLAGLVSKYIGETEKNLDRIFRVARAGNAMLFFDEADALLGKRSEVKDAHDRYANIEVAYLLQKLEEHDGVVILATNQKRNLDDAFARRMHYVIEFPVPDARDRERLWRGVFPSGAPLEPDVDFGFLARQFTLAGGDIRNVALDAAFLAADAGGPIGMREIVRALARQQVKEGKIPSAAEFRQYHPHATGS